MNLISADNNLWCVFKILTDYPRDDLAHDEVHQALITSCVKRKIMTANVDVGSIPGLDTVVAGFKTAQLAVNSDIGFGHIFHTNCAPRKNIVTAKSAGEKIVLGIMPSGVAMLMVNSGYSLAPFYDLAQAGGVTFYQTSVRDEGSQFRSRDYFPDAMAELGGHFTAQAKTLGAAKIEELLKAKNYGEILKGLSYIGEPLKPATLPQLPLGSVIYIDNFGNIKLNYKHADVLASYTPGDALVISIRGTVCDAVVGGTGFSQGEGVIALTSGSSGWHVGAGEKKFFSEIMLRGARAESHFHGIRTGDAVRAVGKKELLQVIDILRHADDDISAKFDLENISEGNIIAMLARSRLIRDGFDATELKKSLSAGDLLQRLS